MIRWLLIIGIVSGFAFGIFNGILMLVAPGRHRKFLAWMGRSKVLVQPGQATPNRRLELERRLAGFTMACFASYVVWSIITGLTTNGGHFPSRPMPSSISGNWILVVFSFLLSAGGAVMIVWPDPIVFWSKKHQPFPADIPAPILDVWKRGARALGVVLMLGGIYALWVTLKYYRG
jgi:hypothetical protein